MKIEPNTIIDQYKIISAIGKGGMGEVFLAQDTKLERNVAIKILPAHFAADIDRMNRFVREAKAVSALNHPNIMTIYEIGESEGIHFIATEFIDGKTLNEYRKDHHLNYRSALEISIQIASALDEAHRAGIVHRDIKPDNVMIRENGLVKLLDFGIAKISGPGNAETPGRGEDEATLLQPGIGDQRRGIQNLTAPGLIIGTANYMSPEQAKGKEVDARSDIFSFGVMLYELVTGKLPFEGETAIEMIGAILRDDPKPVEPEVPNEITSIIHKCLNKDRNERYQTIRDVLTEIQNIKQSLEFQDKLEETVSPEKDEPKTQILQATTADAVKQSTTQQTAPETHLKRYAAVALAVVLISVVGYLGYNYYQSTQPISSIAVLPFESRGSDADSEYLSEGLAESLIYRLSQLPNLKVSPTSSVFRYKGKENDPKIIAQELGVESVLTGRIIQRGDNLSVSVNLVDTRNGRSLWGEKYERKMSDLLATQAEITGEITNKLQLKLSGESEQKLAKKFTENDEAYQLYLRGQFHFSKRSKKDMLKAIEYFEQAIALDPNFALAYVGITNCYSVMPSYGYIAPNDARPKAKAAAEKAVEIDPDLAEAHAAVALVAGGYWDWQKAEREYKKAIELDPNSADVHRSYANYYLVPMGRLKEAIAESKRALELEPLSVVYGTLLAANYYYDGQFDKALEQIEITDNLEPGHPISVYHLGVIYNKMGMYDKAIALAEKGLEKDPFNQDSLGNAGYGYARTGQKRKAEEIIERLREISKDQYVLASYLAQIYGALGEKDKAIAELEKAYDERDSFIPLMNVHTYFDDIRDDPRFAAIAKRAGLPERK